SSVKMDSLSSELKSRHRLDLYDYRVTYTNFGRNGNLEYLASAHASDEHSKTYATTLNSGLQIQVDFDSPKIRGLDFFIAYRVYEKDAQITDTYGLIASPGYPNSYPASSRFTWTILGKSNTFM
uniref:CUB domain-containing protein n=1 Tax=Biomphalaria glabrata TaxID=6526 RepID=A0A2C9KVA1_BIOGL